MTTMDYNQITLDERIRLENMIQKNMQLGYDELIFESLEWLNTPAAKEYFFKRAGRLSAFFEESGINDEWERIVSNRATKGADIAAQVYEYTKKKNSVTDILEYTQTERNVLNNLCDSQYLLVRNSSEGLIQNIRTSMVQDYAAGTHPTETSLRQTLTEGINGWTPEQRAVVIARTETARIINDANLMQYMNDGVTMVEFLASGDACDECSSLEGRPVPIQEALDAPIVHPNCRCTWIPVIPNQ